MKIFKYPLLAFHGNNIFLEMPEGAKVIHVTAQHTQVCMWATVSPGRHIVRRCFRIYGTGREIPDVPGDYLGTALVAGGELVWHVFEVPCPEM